MRPDESTLLDAVAQFLLAEIHPRVEDKAAAFRVLIAANLASVVANRLRADPGHAARAAEEQRSNRALAERVRAAPPEGLAALGAELRERLRAQLSIDNPRFDLSERIE